MKKKTISDLALLLACQQKVLSIEINRIGMDLCGVNIEPYDLGNIEEYNVMCILDILKSSNDILIEKVQEIGNYINNSEKENNNEK